MIPNKLSSFSTSLVVVLGGRFGAPSVAGWLAERLVWLETGREVSNPL